MEELEQLRLENAKIIKERETLNREMEGLRRATGQGPRSKRDLSLQHLIKPWSGEEKGIPVKDFFKEIEAVAASGHWTESDKGLICRMKLAGAAALCVSGHPELQTEQTGFEDYKRILTKRFEDVITPEQHMLELHSVRQGNCENAREFADRCRSLGEKIMSAGGGPEERASERRVVDKLIFAAFLKGLKGEIGRHINYSPPPTLEEAVRKATVMEIVDKGSQGNQKEYQPADAVYALENQPGQVYTSLENVHAVENKPGRVEGCHRCGSPSHWARGCRMGGRGSQGRTTGAVASNQYQKGVNRRETSFHCFRCGMMGHWARNCPSGNQVARNRPPIGPDASLPQPAPNGNPPLSALAMEEETSRGQLSRS